MKVLTLAQPKVDTDRLLGVVDDLRAKVVAGEIIAFCGVGFGTDDECLTWCGTTAPVTKLRMMGAIARLQHGFQAGELDDD